MSIFTPGRAAQLLRFCLVGFTCFAVNILVLAALHELLGVHYVVAFVVVFVLGNALGYWLNKRFTFGLRTALDRASMVRYLTVNSIALVLSTAAVYMLVEWLHVWYLAATIVIAGVNAPVSFVVHRLFTYRMAT